ncbi:DUF7115 domain-containing protein [Haloarchaeobius sp. TZWWS8]|uniref:DUF7115 domain-containing protein n=1 Tax=Haloarchaeobius sp. TZWWS8 TaxID=3446121 RepID=UPI003EBB45C5
MDVPGIVESSLGGEAVAAAVSLGGENVLYVTPSRTLIYQSEGFLSDESVDEYPHDAERMTVKEGRRKTRITLEYPLSGSKDFTVPANATEEVIHPILAGVLKESGVTNEGETVTRTLRFSELTLVITSERLVKHVGNAVWDEDYEEYHYENVTGLDFEDGSVATQVVLGVSGRPERIKVSNERAAEAKEYLQQALFAYYDVSSLAALNEVVRPDEDEEDDRPSPVDFGEGVDPLDAGNTVQPSETPTAEPESALDEHDVNLRDDHGAHAGADTMSADQQASLDDRPADDRRPDPGHVDRSTPEPTRSDTPEETHHAQESERPVREQRTAGSAAPSEQSETSDPAAEAKQVRHSAATEADEPATSDTTVTDTATADPASASAPVDSTAAGTDVTSDAASTDASAGTATESNASSTETTAAPSESVDSADVPDELDDSTEDGQNERNEADAPAQEEEETDGIADERFEQAGFEPAKTADDEILERLDDLEQQVVRQNELLVKQQRTIERLVERLDQRR